MHDFLDRLSYLFDPAVYEVRRLPAHIPLPLQKGLTLPLDGTWRAAVYPAPGAVDEALLLTGEPPLSCEVPGHLQLQGLCGVPQYVNKQYPWDGRESLLPPAVPRDNPTALYMRTFALPEAFAEKTVRLCFDGAEPCLYVYVNGAFAGYAEDSFSPSEFDVTALVRPGENRLCAVVPRYCTGSWLEDQDFWRFSGLFRGVTLYALPKTHLLDASLETALNDDFSEASLTVRARVFAERDLPAEATLSLSDAETVAPVSLRAGENTLTLSLPVHAPRLWTAETPHLYDARLTLRTDGGEPLVELPLRVGFRRFERRGNRLLLNGKRVVFRGVNRHEWSCTRGRVLTREQIVSDVLALKQNNFNAVRTSHYPNRTELYDLCDEYGLYVIDETNLETHGTWQTYDGKAHPEHALPGDNGAWRAAALDRARSLLERDKLHPCVLFWSCGNESCGGSVLFDVAAYFRTRDPSRLVHYEGVFHDRRFPDTSDVESQMYTTPSALAAFLADHPDQPMLLCEYAHAMGNSFGNVDEYLALLDRFPHFHGGFVWDWQDQTFFFSFEKEKKQKKTSALVGRNAKDGCADEKMEAAREDTGASTDENAESCSADGRMGAAREDTGASAGTEDAYIDYRLADGSYPAWRVGGDFFDRPNDRYFCGNGLLFGDRTPSPKLREAKFLYQPFSFVCGADGVTVTNRQTFLGAGAYRFCWTLMEDGVPRAYGAFRAEIAPGQTRRVPLSLPLDAYTGELTLSCAAVLEEDAPYAPAGHEAAFGQGVLRSAKHAAYAVSAPAPLIEGDANYGARTASASALLSRATGELYSLFAGRELLLSPLTAQFWRAPTDNDLANGFVLRAARWKLLSLYRQAASIDADAAYGSVRVRFCAGGDAAYTVTHRFFADGSLTLTLDLPPVAEELPCAGLELTLPADVSRLTWYGNAAHCAAPDRRNALRLALCSADVRAEYVPYPRPQMNAVKTDVRYLTLCDAEGNGLRVSAETPFCFAALPWTCHEIEHARSAAELPPSTKTVLTLYGAMRGVGGDDSWGAQVHPAYRVSAESGLSCTFHIEPLTGRNA